MIPTISFTFDDGFESIYLNALKKMNKIGFKATVFVTTSMVGLPGHLSWEQIRELMLNGWEIGSHTHTHPKLNKLSTSELIFQLEISKRLLEKRLNAQVVGFAYPFGGADTVCEREMKYVSKYYNYARLNGDGMSYGYINKEPIYPYALIGKCPNIGFNTLDEFMHNINIACKNGGWFIFFTHYLEKYSIPSLTEFVEMLKYTWKLVRKAKIRVLPISSVIYELHTLSLIQALPNSNLFNSLTRYQWFQDWLSSSRKTFSLKQTNFYTYSWHLIKSYAKREISTRQIIALLKRKYMEISTCARWVFLRDL